MQSIPNTCCVCEEPIGPNRPSVLQTCGCLIVQCFPCARLRVVDSPQTYHEGLTCLACGEKTPISPSIKGDLVSVQKCEDTLINNAFQFSGMNRPRNSSAKLTRYKGLLERYLTLGLVDNEVVEDYLECTDVHRLSLFLARLECKRGGYPQDDQDSQADAGDGLPLGPLLHLRYPRNTSLERILSCESCEWICDLCGEGLTTAPLYNCECAFWTCIRCCLMSTLHLKGSYKGGPKCSLCRTVFPDTFVTTKEALDEERSLLAAIVAKHSQYGRKYKTNSSKDLKEILINLYSAVCTDFSQLESHRSNIDSLSLAQLSLEIVRTSQRISSAGQISEGEDLGPLRLVRCRTNPFVEVFLLALNPSSSSVQVKQAKDDEGEFMQIFEKVMRYPTKLDDMERSEALRRQQQEIADLTKVWKGFGWEQQPKEQSTEIVRDVLDRLVAARSTSTACTLCDFNPHSAHYLALHMQSQHAMDSLPAVKGRAVEVKLEPAVTVKMETSAVKTETVADKTKPLVNAPRLQGEGRIPKSRAALEEAEWEEPVASKEKQREIEQEDIVIIRGNRKRSNAQALTEGLSDPTRAKPSPNPTAPLISTSSGSSKPPKIAQISTTSSLSPHSNAIVAAATATPTSSASVANPASASATSHSIVKRRETQLISLPPAPMISADVGKDKEKRKADNHEERVRDADLQSSREASSMVQPEEGEEPEEDNKEPEEEEEDDDDMRLNHEDLRRLLAPLQSRLSGLADANAAAEQTFATEQGEVINISRTVNFFQGLPLRGVYEIVLPRCRPEDGEAFRESRSPVMGDFPLPLQLRLQAKDRQCFCSLRGYNKSDLGMSSSSGGNDAGELIFQTELQVFSSVFPISVLRRAIEKQLGFSAEIMRFCDEEGRVLHTKASFAALAVSRRQPLLIRPFSAGNVYRSRAGAAYLATASTAMVKGKRVYTRRKAHRPTQEETAREYMRLRALQQAPSGTAAVAPSSSSSADAKALPSFLVERAPQQPSWFSSAASPPPAENFHHQRLNGREGESKATRETAASSMSHQEMLLLSVSSDSDEECPKKCKPGENPIGWEISTRGSTAIPIESAAPKRPRYTFHSLPVQNQQNRTARSDTAERHENRGQRSHQPIRDNNFSHSSEERRRDNGHHGGGESSRQFRPRQRQPHRQPQNQSHSSDRYWKPNNR